MATIDKAYDPSEVETTWYTRWLEANCFSGHVNEGADPHCIMIPPPNVTGMLHMGHILNNTLQDIFTRRARLEGKSALWFPGTDHAGIATQTRVEKKLRAEGKDRREMGREAFLEEVVEWKDKHGGIILNQLKKLGASCDWDRTSFTLDPQYSRAVLHSFVHLFNEGYIYRGLRMSNWCPVSLTALSNEEVNMKPQSGLFYTMKYELVELPGEFIEISTTRPETIMGDVAVAVNPDDERYKHLIGKHVWRPFPRKEIPIIADNAVDLEFGTGALKVTPAHDQVDFDIGKRHNLPIIDVFNPDATLNALAGEEFEGLDRFEARKKAARKLEELGLLVGTKPYENSVGFSERADVPIEPRLTEQWWLRYPKVAEAKRAVEIGAVRFHPQRWEKTYLHWLDTMERDQIDWCISRQLWWGHRIPVWYKKGIDRSSIDLSDPEQIHVSVDGPEDPENWEQDEDVLDTWASSWLWPFANFGWPEAKSADLNYFYPTQTLVTGFDIIFLWVARMVMAGLEFMGDAKKSLSDEEIKQRIPFRDVYITGLIRDNQGRKMSKSLGNSPDPLDLIKKFGSDGLRFGIVNIAPSGQDILFSEDRIELGRNFCNKLWNATRFRQMQGESEKNESLDSILERFPKAGLDPWDDWILSRLIETTSQVERAFERYEMHAYPHHMYEFFWNDYCDWYVEAAKPRLRDDAKKGSVLAVQDFVMRQTLLLLQPIIPFICEELWSKMGYAGAEKSFLQETKIPRSEELAEALAGFRTDRAGEIGRLRELVTQIRSLKSEYQIANRKDIDFFLLADPTEAEFIREQESVILNLCSIASIQLTEKRPEGMPAGVTAMGSVFLDLATAIDLESEIQRLTKELEKLEKGLKAGESKLKNEKFMQNAPDAVVAGARKQLEETQSRWSELNQVRSDLENLLKK